MSNRKKSGQAVMAVMMGIMLIGGAAVWMTTGHFHMMPMHEKTPTKSETISAPVRGAETSHHSAPAETGHGAVAGPESGFRHDVDGP